MSDPGYSRPPAFPDLTKLETLNLVPLAMVVTRGSEVRRSYGCGFLQTVQECKP